MEYKEQEELLYPEGLINWSGAKDGGVRKPFQKQTGRPVKEQLTTPLVEKLSAWVGSILKGEPEAPTAILLVGGPGNGKTDAVEGAIENFDKLSGANGQLLAKFAEQYELHSDSLPPRRTEVMLDSQAFGLSTVTPTIRLVQDATDKDPAHPEETAESLLLNELREIKDGKYTGIYIGCVNRGILANTSALAIRNNDKEMASFISNIISAVSGGVDAPACWPFLGSRLAIWPMDVDSLVAPINSSTNRAVAHQILDKALEDTRWQQACTNSFDCPFCQNKILLSNKQTRDNLIKFLYYYELASGKRWTFRDLYSLISHLFIGEPGSLTIDSKTYSPCDWTAKMLQLEAKGPSTLVSVRARYLLTSRLYHHRLFSNWPRLASGKHLEAYQAVLASTKAPDLTEIEGFNRAKYHFGSVKTLSEKEHNDISELLAGDFATFLDPALLHGEIILYLDEEHKAITANAVDENFSLSVKDGLTLISSRITASEQRLLMQLSVADEALMGQHHPTKVSKQARRLQSSIRHFAGRLAKRSLGVKYGISKDLDLYRHYADLYKDDTEHESLEDLVEQLVNDDRRFFRIPLSTTFGQPVAHWDREVSLRVRSVRTSMQMFRGDINRPANRFPFMKVHNRYIPVTFALYKALVELEEGLDPASLPREVFALFDEVKSVTAGQIARDKNFVDGNVDLIIGRDVFPLKVGNIIRFKG